MLGRVALRDTPRWSVVGPAGSPLPMAGLPRKRDSVLVGPPKLPKPSNSGSSGLLDVPVRSDATQPLLPSVTPIRLWPPDVTVPNASGPLGAVLLATMVLRMLMPLPE